MTLVKRILFPVDFSARCSKAGAWVAAVTRHFGAELMLRVRDRIAALGYFGTDPALLTAAFSLA